MILSKSLILKNTILKSLRYHQQIHSANLHVLRSSILHRPITLKPVVCNVLCRYESSNTKDTILNLPNNTSPASPPLKDTLPDIPVPGAEPAISSAPELPEIIADAIVPLNKLGEPALQSIGLGSYYTPVGWIQHALDFLHATCGFSWWASIVTSVVFIRLLMFPLVIKQQRYATGMHNVMPEMMKLQDAVQEARVQGNQIEIMKNNYKLAEFMQTTGANPLKGMILPLVQAPIFLSYFMALRKMAAAPVESMTVGGMYWFVDLTLPDQYYVLPLLVSASLSAILEFGVDMNLMSSSSSMTRIIKIGFKVIPVAVFPFIMNFPSGLCVYWLSTNIVSFVQVMTLKIPNVRKFFKIEVKKRIEDPNLKTSPKRFITDVKDSFRNMKISKQLDERERLDQMNFTRAGKSPPVKTFKVNPVTAQSESTPVKKKFHLK